MRDSEETLPGYGLSKVKQFPNQILRKLVRKEDEDRELDEKKVPVDGRALSRFSTLDRPSCRKPVLDGTGVH